MWIRFKISDNIQEDFQKNGFDIRIFRMWPNSCEIWDCQNQASVSKIHSESRSRHHVIHFFQNSTRNILKERQDSHVFKWFEKLRLHNEFLLPMLPGNRLKVLVVGLKLHHPGWVEIRLHTENWLPRFSGSASNVSV